MIINNRKDLDAAPDHVREQFIARLAGSINKWEWDGAKWELTQDESTISKFDFALADFPNPPTPEMPDFNPDQKEREQLANEVRANRDALLAESDWTQVADAPVDDVAWAGYRQELRDIPQQDGFPHDVIWPAKPE